MSDWLTPIRQISPIRYPAYKKKMKESVLRKYFDKEISAIALNQDVDESQIKTGFDTTSLEIEIMEDNDEYIITTEHLIELAADTISNKITFQNLATIAFALEGSDCFIWDSETKDGERVAKVLFEWDNEIINYPIDYTNLNLWSVYLKTGEHNLNR